MHKDEEALEKSKHLSDNGCFVRKGPEEIECSDFMCFVLFAEVQFGHVQNSGRQALNHPSVYFPAVKKHNWISKTYTNYCKTHIYSSKQLGQNIFTLVWKRFTMHIIVYFSNNSYKIFNSM